MAIVTEIVTINGTQFIHTYSDADRYIVGGEPYGIYADAYDPADANRVYVEGEPMPPDEVSSDEAMEILFGGEA